MDELVHQSEGRAVREGRSVSETKPAVEIRLLSDPMYLAGAKMTETFPVPTLHPGFSLSIGVTSYDGQVSYGLTGDREVLADLHLLGQCIQEALEELLESTSGLRTRAARGRKRP